MKSNNLLNHLTNLEGQLHHFSFEELTSEEASLLKKSFMTFKYRLEEKVLGPKSNVSSPHTNYLDFESALGKKESSNPLKNSTNREEGRLFEKVGDEIRSPINGILETIDLLKEGNITAEQRSQLHTITNSTNHLLDTIGDLLDYTRLVAGKESFESVDFNFQSVIKDTIYLCNALIINKDVKLEIDLDTKIPVTLAGDPSKLSQILLTLLGNSIKLIDKGNILLKIKLRRQHRDYLVLDFEIRDVRTGNIQSDLKAHVPNIEPHSIDMGIGFAMVEGILEILNGSLATMAGLDDGCTYKFTIPYKMGRQQKPAGSRHESNSTTTTDNILEGLHILVFEDNILIQKIIEQRLKNWGCRVHVTANGLAGMDYLLEHRVDLVLMDLGMPGMNGFEITQIIRESHDNHIKNLPIIALTGNFTINDKIKCNALGIADYILKPYSPDELLTTLGKYKKKHRPKPTKKSVEGEAPFAVNKEAWKISLADILEECMGEIDLLEELVGLFKQNMLDFIGRANVYIPEGNFSRLGFAAHKVKTGLSMMKADHLYSLVDQITIGCKTHRNLPEIGRLYDQLLLAYSMVEKAIDRELRFLKSNER